MNFAFDIIEIKNSTGQKWVQNNSLLWKHQYSQILALSNFVLTLDDSSGEEPRLLGLAMIPGRHVVSMHIDMDKQLEEGVQKLKENQTETEADKKTESKEPDDINSETVANPQNPNGKCDGDKSIKTWI